MAIDLSGEEYESTGFELIPKGSYPMTATDWEERETREGKTYYTVKFTIFGEKYANRVIFENFWLGEGFSENAQVLAKTKVRSFMEAANEPLQFDSYGELFSTMLDKPVVGTVGISVSKDPQFQDKNTIWRFKNISELEGDISAPGSFEPDVDGKLPF